MSNITYTPETHSKLEEWIDSCPRELANVVMVHCFMKKDEENIHNIGTFSVVQTSLNDALNMYDEAINNIQEQKAKLLQGKSLEMLQRMLDRSKDSE